MKRLLTIVILLTASLHCNAQWISDVRLDDGLYAFRTAALPDYHFPADDYVQYSPAAAMLLLKACGVEGRSNWGSLMVSAAMSTVLEAVFVNSLKYSIGRLRPDESANNSFPSGHTASAFMTATLLQKEYGWKYPWIGFGGYAIACGTGFSRILNNKHWQSDVIGGMIVGVAAGELGYWLSDLIFKGKGHTPGFIDGPGWRERIAESDGASLYSRLPYELEAWFSTAAWFMPYGSSFEDLGTGETVPKELEGKRSAFSMAGIGASIPFAKHLGACVRIGVGGREYNYADRWQTRSYSAFFEGMAGIYADWNFYSLAFVRPHAYIGAGFGKGYAFGTSPATVSCRPQCAAGVDLGLQITDNYALKFIADYEYSFRNWSGIMLGGSAAFCF